MTTINRNIINIANVIFTIFYSYMIYIVLHSLFGISNILLPLIALNLVLNNRIYKKINYIIGWKHKLIYTILTFIASTIIFEYVKDIDLTIAIILLFIIIGVMISAADIDACHSELDFIVSGAITLSGPAIYIIGLIHSSLLIIGTISIIILAYSYIQTKDDIDRTTDYMRKIRRDRA